MMDDKMQMENDTPGISFRQIVEGVEDNNSINDGRWADWSDADHILETYGPMRDEDVSEQRAADVLNRAIATDGRSLALDLAKIQREVKGQNYSGSWWNREGDIAPYRDEMIGGMRADAAALGIKEIVSDLAAVVEEGRGADRGMSIGKVLKVDKDRGVAFQEVGQGKGAIIPLAALEGAPLVEGQVAVISFRDGRGVVSSREQGKDRGRG